MAWSIRTLARKNGRRAIQGNKLVAFIRSNNLQRVLGFLLGHSVLGLKAIESLIFVREEVDPGEFDEVVDEKQEGGKTS